MKPVLAWVKSNILIVIAAVVIVVPLPVAYYFSAQWNAGIREGQEDKLSAAKRTVTGASRVTYTLPAIADGEGDLTETRTPNALVSEWYAERLGERRAAVDEVLGLAESVNRASGRPVLGDHRPVFSGLFPGPESRADRIRLVDEFFDAVTGEGAGDETMYDRMLEEIGAASPPDAEDLAMQLATQEENLRSRYEDDPRDQDDIDEEISTRLVNQRLNSYAAFSRQAGVYMTADAFHSPAALAGIATATASPVSLGLDVPRTRRIREQEGNPVMPAECFVWQWDLWIYADVLSAIAEANRVGRTGESGVRGAVVKRVDTISISQFPLPGMAAAATSERRRSGSSGQVLQEPIDWEMQSSQGPRGRDERSPLSRSEDDADSPPDSVATHTGRRLSQKGQALTGDIRRVAIDAVVASERLPILLDQLGRANLMTVVDVDLSEVDVIADLREGYDYGPDHVVRATILVESMWLRSWTGPIMPEAVRDVLGVPAPVAPDEDTPSEDG